MLHVHVDLNKSMCEVCPYSQPGFVFQADQFPNGGFAVAHHRSRFSQDCIQQHAVEVEKPVDIATHMLFNHEICPKDCRICSRTKQVEGAAHASRNSSTAAAIRWLYNTFACGAFNEGGGFGNLVQGKFAIGGR
jgi:hypothetical protein